MGSGHILCYLFDVLVQIYEAYGYSTREAVRSILENNLYGLDIDDRAAQLAYFAVMMKARQYDRRFFTRGIQPHVMAIQESNALEEFDRLQGQLSLDNMCLETANQLIRTFRDAKEYGSILQVDIPGLESADCLMEQLRAVQGDFELMAWVERAEALLPVLAQQAVIMQQKYDVVVTNPPYMGSSGMGGKLSQFVKDFYPDSKSDLFACFIEKGNSMVKPNAFNCMVTMQSWMFLSSFEKMRIKCLKTRQIANLMHMENMVLGIAFGTAVTVFRNNHISGYKGTFNQIKLQDVEDGQPSQFPVSGNRFAQVSTDNFAKIPGSPVAYWVSEAVFKCFKHRLLSSVANPKKGLDTGKNDRFLRLWQEVAVNRLCLSATNIDEAKATNMKWFPCTKGGTFRRWYGNNEYIIDWENNGKCIKEFSGSNIRNERFYFLEGMSWSTLTNGNISMRYQPSGSLFESKGSKCFVNDHKDFDYILALLNSIVIQTILSIVSPTIDYHEGPLGKIPIIFPNESGTKSKVEQLSKNCVNNARSDWDSYETSWDFTMHPLVAKQTGLYIRELNEKPNYFLWSVYKDWQHKCKLHFQQLKANEEELNRIFIDIYGLQDELTPEVADKDVTVHRVFDTKDEVPESMQGSAYVRTRRDEVVSLISYAVGCMLGRYSLDVPGLAFAGGEWDAGKYATFPADRDGILPICDDDYFTDDIVSRFVQFVEVVYGRETLEENLKFIADALGGRGTPREVIRGYFLNDFYADHCKTYQKRPIYWLFDSGKKNGFKCLIYMHRYAPDTIARIRTDYVHEQQSRYRTAIADLEKRVAAASTAERVKLQKQLNKLRDQAEETRVYEEKIHHFADQMIAIDLDDGVKVNYAKFADVLGKIK